MAYTVPLVRVFQNILSQPQVGTRFRRTHVAGGEAFLVRYAEEDERILGRLGFYDRLVAADYSWPNKPAGSTIDQSYAKIYVKDALLKYFADGFGSGSSIQTVSGAPNKVRSSTINFAANGDTYPRANSLYDRDVQVGDIVKARAVDEDDEIQTVWSYVKAIEGDDVATAPAAATTDEDNPATQIAGHDGPDLIAGPENCIVPTADHANYDGLPSGDINEVYDVVVIEGSVNSDPTTATLRVISGSGRDDVLEVTPATWNTPFAIGTRGLTMTLVADNSAGCSASADDAEVSYHDLQAGQRWRIEVSDAFTKPVPTSGGTYDHTESTVYIVTVTKGGAWADSPEITVTTSNGVDVSGPTVVSAAATPVAVGSYGTEIEFTGNGLRKGDKYYIEVTGVVEGPMRTIVMGHSFPASVAAGSDVDLTLFIKKSDLQIPRNQVDNPPNTNWETSATEISLIAGITAYDSTWTDDGDPLPLELWSEESKNYGIVYVEYRAWISTHVGIVGSIEDVGELDSTFAGALTPDNPLKYGVYSALLEAGGQAVLFTGVSDPDDVDAWVDVLDLLWRRRDVYNLVPLTRNNEVRQLYVAHVNAASGEDKARWRRCWFTLEGVPAIPLVAAGSDVPGHTLATTEDGEVCLCTIQDDPDTSGSQFTILQCTSNNGNFVTNGVQPGDVVRAAYTTDGFGAELYSEFIVDAVLAEDLIRLAAGPDAPINMAARTEIWRTLAASAEAAEIARNAGAYGNKRVSAVWPDYIESGTTSIEGYFLCCAKAAQSSSIVPHQGLTRVALSGYTSVQRSTNKFNSEQMDVMAAAGVSIVTQDEQDGTIFNRHEVTTGDTDLIADREEMIVRNLDDISYGFQELYDPLIGRTNAVPDVQQRISDMGTDYLKSLELSFYTRDLGGQVVSGSIASVRRDAIAADKFVVNVDLTLPAPLNNIDVMLNVSV